MNLSQNSISEKDLVCRLIKDDEEAFCELYARYKNRLVYFAMKFIKSKEFAEDIYQDTFTAIWQTRHFINPNSQFSAYLYTIVRNRILNMLRDLKAENQIEDYILAQAIDYNEDTHAKITENELATLLSEAVSKLTNRQKQVFEMSRNREMSHKEIAAELNISIHTVQEHISLALKSIQTFLNKKYGNISSLIIIICLNQ